MRVKRDHFGFRALTAWSDENDGFILYHAVSGAVGSIDSPSGAASGGIIKDQATSASAAACRDFMLSLLSHTDGIVE